MRIIHEPTLKAPEEAERVTAVVLAALLAPIHDLDASSATDSTA